MVVTFLSRVQESRRRGDFNGGDIVCLVLGLEVFGPVAVRGSRRHGDFNGGDIPVARSRVTSLFVTLMVVTLCAWFLALRSLALSLFKGHVATVTLMVVTLWPFFGPLLVAPPCPSALHCARSLEPTAQQSPEFESALLLHLGFRVSVFGPGAAKP